jgi:hypothetical protein
VSFDRPPRHESDRSSDRFAPCSSTHRELLADFRPIVQRGWIEVRPVRPDERPGFRIQSCLAEHSGISERFVQLARKHRAKVDDLLGIVVEDHPNGVRTDLLEGLHTMNRVSHQPIVTAQWEWQAVRLATDPNLVAIRPWCSSAHASTSRRCVLGSSPAINSTGEMLNTADCPW